LSDWGLSTTCLTLACTHVIKVPLECGPGPQPIGRSAIGWERIPGKGHLSGRVASPSLSPIEGARIDLSGLSLPPPRERITSSNAVGEFSFDSTQPDRYLLRVRRLGYSGVADTLRLTPDSGVVATVLLVQHKLILDDCDLAYTEKRVPWWRREQ
jgi:hypothetical protein